jgi:cytochrome c2
MAHKAPAQLLARLALMFVATLGPAGAFAAGTPSVETAQQAWARHPQGRMLERILPRAIEASQLPDADSRGAQLAARYCVQCHFLPNPGMHSATRWKTVIERMVWRMQGNGNLGRVMTDMMSGLRAPTIAEAVELGEYFARHAQREIASSHPALKTREGEMFSIACSQCHALPDPSQHTAAEWPGIVKRMQRHMAWANTVTGTPALRTDPELDTAAILRLLQQYARR